MFILNNQQVEERELVRTIRAGDVGCVHEKRNPFGWAIQKWTGSPINHVYIYTGIVLDANHNVFGINRKYDTHLIIEAVAKGVSVMPLDNYLRDSCRVEFVRHTLATNLDGQRVTNNMFKLVNHPYDWAGLVGFLFRKLYPFRYNFLNKKTSYFCSESVGSSFGHERLFFRTDIDVSYLSPSDIWNSKMVIKL